ncbi:hypothetical protein PSPO_b1378 [Pseudoalteromonas spongiae UST010723-006]|nr:hypothetical protein PSPO_b1378 [Pseudoalteromonas spongiae UST010723-006]
MQVGGFSFLTLIEIILTIYNALKMKNRKLFLINYEIVTGIAHLL